MVCLVLASTGIIKWPDAITSEKLICKFMVKGLSFFCEEAGILHCEACVGRTFNTADRLVGSGIQREN